jgi:TRAP-type C4-dicarboxylate transport system permease small subunit
MLIYIRRWLDRILEPVLVMLLFALVVTVLWQVFSRYVLQAPSTATDEIARFLLMWTALLGAAWAVGQRAHLAIHLLIEKLRPSKAVLLHRFICLLIIVFSFAVMIVGGINLVRITLLLEQSSTVLQVPIGWVYVVLPLSGCIMAIYSTCDGLVSSKDALQQIQGAK